MKSEIDELIERRNKYMQWAMDETINDCERQDYFARAMDLSEVIGYLRARRKRWLRLKV